MCIIGVGRDKQWTAGTNPGITSSRNKAGWQELQFCFAALSVLSGGKAVIVGVFDA